MKQNSNSKDGVVKHRERVWRERVALLADETQRAYVVALRATGSSSIAEEAVQEAYLKMLRRSIKDLCREDLLAYFFSVVRGTALDIAKMDRRRKQREDDQAMTAKDLDQSPDVEVMRVEIAQAARTALAALPQKEREAVSVRFELNLNRRMVSKILNVPEQTVVDRSHRGLIKIR